MPDLQPTPDCLVFERYRLDLARGSLWRDKTEIALRPKTMAVLVHLVAHAGRLVSKDELFAAVWTDVAVTDDTLVQSIGELRRALEDDGQRLIRTVPRRGYRFEAAVSRGAADDPPPAGPARAPAGGPSAVDRSGRWPRWANPSLLPAFRDRQRALLFACGALGVAAILLAGVVWRRLPDDGQRPVQSMRDARPSIAILPFTNQSGEPGRAYLADGMTQDLISAMGRFSGLTVMSWNAVSSPAGKPERPSESSDRLGVRYQVEGTVQWTADMIRVNAQLIDRDGRILWSGRFDERPADLFALQDRITAQMAGALDIRVTDAEQHRALAKPTASLQAYDYVLRARPALQRPSRAMNVEARAWLKRAIELDPRYAAAYAAMAETFHIDVSWGWSQSPATSLARAEELAKTALSLSEDELPAHIVLGKIYLFQDRYELAKAEMDRAVAINPNDAHGLAGRGNILLWLGQTDDAIISLELAQRIDPTMNAIDRFSLSLAYYLKERYAEAVEQGELNLRNSESSVFSHAVLAASFAQQDRSADVARVMSVIDRLDPAFDPWSFGSKFQNPDDLERLRQGFRKAGFAAAARTGRH